MLMTLLAFMALAAASDEASRPGEILIHDPKSFDPTSSAYPMYTVVRGVPTRTRWHRLEEVVGIGTFELMWDLGELKMHENKLRRLLDTPVWLHETILDEEVLKEAITTTARVVIEEVPHRRWKGQVLRPVIDFDLPLTEGISNDDALRMGLELGFAYAKIPFENGSIWLLAEEVPPVATRQFLSSQTSSRNVWQGGKLKELFLDVPIERLLFEAHPQLVTWPFNLDHPDTREAIEGNEDTIIQTFLSPQTFLYLTGDLIEDDPNTGPSGLPEDWFKKFLPDRMKRIREAYDAEENVLPIPELWIAYDEDTGFPQVVQHEGRHRAAQLINWGEMRPAWRGATMPVIFHMTSLKGGKYRSNVPADMPERSRPRNIQEDRIARSFSMMVFERILSQDWGDSPVWVDVFPEPQGRGGWSGKLIKHDDGPISKRDLVRLENDWIDMREPYWVKLRRDLGLIPTLQFDLDSKEIRQRSRREIVWIDPRKLDPDWMKDEGFYIGEGGTGAAIDTRYPDFIEWLDRGIPINPPRLGFIDGHPEHPVIGFGNGRHRFAVLRDMNQPAIPVLVPRGQAAEMRKRYAPVPELAT